MDKRLNFIIAISLILSFSRPVFAEPLETKAIHQFLIYPELISMESLNDQFHLKAEYSFIPERHYLIESGCSYNPSGNYLNAYFFSAGYKDIFDSGLGLMLKYLNSSYKEYSFIENCFIPHMIYSKYNFTGKLGLNMRYLSTDDAIRQNDVPYSQLPLLSYYLSFSYKIPFWENKYILELEANNMDSLDNGNSNNFGYFIKNSITYNKTLDFIVNLGLRPAGQLDLSVIGERVIIQAGARCKI